MSSKQVTIRLERKDRGESVDEGDRPSPTQKSKMGGVLAGISGGSKLRAVSQDDEGGERDRSESQFYSGTI